MLVRVITPLKAKMMGIRNTLYQFGRIVQKYQTVWRKNLLTGRSSQPCCIFRSVNWAILTQFNGQNNFLTFLGVCQISSLKNSPVGLVQCPEFHFYYVIDGPFCVISIKIMFSQGVNQRLGVY